MTRKISAAALAILVAAGGIASGDPDKDREIHRGAQLHWLGVGLGVIGLGLAAGSVPVWRAATGCTDCAPQIKIVGDLGALGMDGLALIAVAAGVGAWAFGTSTIERARAAPLVVPVRGGAVMGVVAVF